MFNLIYLSLGSNIRPEENLKEAVQALANLTNLLAVSSVWETRPLGRTDQPNFLNAGAVVETGLTLEQFKKKVIASIEQSLGRVRSADKYAPRPIDIDMILFNQEIFDLDNRHIPDPELLERPFVVIPLAEIAPDYRHPETGQTLAEIARSFKVTEEEMRLRPDVSQVVAQFKTYPDPIGLTIA